jgi:hypothetical protein
MQFKAILIAAFALVTTVLAVPAPEDAAVQNPIKCSTNNDCTGGSHNSIIFHIEVEGMPLDHHAVCLAGFCDKIL